MSVLSDLVDQVPTNACGHFSDAGSGEAAAACAENSASSTRKLQQYWVHVNHLEYNITVQVGCWTVGCCNATASLVIVSSPGYVMRMCGGIDGDICNGA